MANEQDQERTLPATPKRLEDARSEGRVARSPELAGALTLTVIAGAVWLAGPTWIAHWQRFLRTGLRLSHNEAMEEAAPMLRLTELSWDAFLLFAPVAGLAALGAIGGMLAVGGWLFEPKAFNFNFERMSPLAAFGRIFSLQGLAELGKTLLKTALIGVAGGLMAWHFTSSAAGLSAAYLPEALNTTGHMLTMTFGALVLAMALIAAVDVPMQLWRYYSGLRMSAEEVRREQRESDGDPQIKSRVRNMQREMAKRRMMQEVPKADVIVTNPTHYAVALVYREGKMRAPRVVAKGVDHVAQAIRELGAQHKVPLLEAPPLARALYAHGELDRDIPVELYGVVAQVLAWVFQLRRHLAGEAELPVAPKALEVPADLDPANTAAATGASA
jgi:flagellar biosynthetic protein FlhB